MNNDKKELRRKLREKLQEKQINRASHQAKNNILKQSMSQMGLDAEKFKEDLNNLQKEKGFSINLNDTNING
jgi:predicted DsbA family dithiol-disulfide isomerase